MGAFDDLIPSGSGNAFEDLIPDSPKGSLSRSFKAASEDVAGAIGAGLDVVGSLPGLVGAGTAAAMRGVDTNTGRGPMETLKAIMESSSKGNVMDYVPGMESLRKMGGYEPMSEAISGAMTVPAQGLGNIAAAASSATGLGDPSKVGEYTDVLTQAAILLAGLKPEALAKPGTPKFFEEQAKIKASKELMDQNKEIRDQYVQQALKEQEQTIKSQKFAEDFKGAQQGAFDDLIPQEMRSPYGDMSNLQVDPQTGMPFKADLSREVAKTELGTEPPVQGDMFGQPDIGLQLKQPVPFEDAAPKQLPDPSVAPLEGANAAEAVHTPEWHQTMLDFLNAVEPDLATGKPVEYNAPGKPSYIYGKPLGQTGFGKGQRGALDLNAFSRKANSLEEERVQLVKDRNAIKQRYLSGRMPPELAHRRIKEIQDQLDAVNKKSNQVGAILFNPGDKPIGQTKIGGSQRGSIGWEKDKPIDEGRTLGEAETKDMQDKLDREAVDHLEGKHLSQEARAASRAQDLHLVQQFVKGDGSALKALYEKYSPKLQAVLERKLGDKARAEDLVQQTFITAAQAMPKFRGDAAVGTWLHAIAINKFKDFIKTENRHGNLGGHEELTPEMADNLGSHNIDSPEQAMIAKEMRDHLDKAFESLPEEQKQVVNLVLFEQQSYKDAARLLEIPIGTVQSRLSRAQESMKQSVSRQERGHPLGGVGKKQGGAIIINEMNRKMRSKGPALAIRDALKQFSIERRPLDQVVAEEKITPDSLKDLGDIKDQSITGRIGNLQKVAASNLLIDKSMSILTESKGAIGKIAKWAVDGRREISREAGNAIRDKVKSAFESWNKVVASKGQLGSVGNVLSKMQEHIRGKDLSREDFKTDHEYKIFKEVSDILEQTRVETNDLRAKYKLTPLEKINNYLPSTLEGEYLITVRDSTGKVVRTDASWTSGKASHKAEAYGKIYDDTHTVEWNLKGKDINDIKNLSAFDDMIRNMSEEDPLRVVAQRTKVEIMSRRSFGRHSMHREGTAAGLGWENTPASSKAMRKVIEQYITQAENYKANIRVKELQEQFEKLGPEFHDRVPMFTDWLRDYFEISRGINKDKLPWIAQGIQQVSILLGQGRNGGIRAVQNASAVMMMFLNMRPTFFLQNFPQAINSMAKVVDLHQTTPGVLSGTQAVMQGLSNIFSRDATTMELARLADKKGYLDSSWVSMMHLSINDMHESRLGVLGDVTNWSIGKNEHHVVREPALFIFEAALRDAVPDKAKRFEMAMEMMDYYMVSSDRKGAPQVYNKAGPILGGSARPLKSYAHNTYGQFFEFLQTAKEQGRYAPLATYLGTQAMLSGLKGVMLFADASAIVYVMNQLFGTQITTPEELLYGAAGKVKESVKDASSLTRKVVGNGMDALVYGGYSVLLGQDISPSTNAPAASQMLSFPVAKWTKDAAVDVLTWAVHYIQGKDTRAEQMKAAMSGLPKAARGEIEHQFTIPGQPVPRPTDEMKGNYVRGELNQGVLGRIPGATEDNVARLLGTHSIDESTMNALTRFARAKLAQDMKQKKTALEMMVDNVSNGQEIEQKDVQRYVEEGGKVGNLPNLIRQGVLARSLPFADRSLRGSVSPALAHRAQVEEQLSQEQQRQRASRGQ